MLISSTFMTDADCVIFEGSCQALLRQIPSNLIKLVVTSPPYNIGKPYEKKLNLNEYLSQQKEVIGECTRVLHRSGSICWQVGNYINKGKIIPLDIALYPIFASFGLHLRNRIVWHFGHGLHASKRFSGRYEVILWFTKSDTYFFNLDAVRVRQKYPQKKHFKGPQKGKLSSNPLGKNPTDIWDIPNVKANHVEKTVHPCQFPVELVERLVLSMTEEWDWVLDPFMGVGSTLVAALIHNRKAAGAEILPEYTRIARERINLAQRGELRIRPIERSVFDPLIPNNVPPRTVQIRKSYEQFRLFEKHGGYKKGES